MNLEEFQENLLGTLDEDQEIREEAIYNLDRYKEADYCSFLKLALESIENPINERITAIAITRIYTEAKNGSLFEDENSLATFIDLFSENITAELLSEHIEDHFKKLLSTTLGIIHVYVFKNSGDLTIPNYILTNYTEIPQIKPYLMNCIYEISIGDQDFGGFELEDLMTILLDDLTNQSLFESRIHLYFALAKNSPDLDFLHQWFNSLIIEPILNQEYNSVIIISIANFADINSYFFAPHTNELFEGLLNISLDQELSDDLRESAIIAIMSIARNAPEMIKSIENFYETVVAPLVLIVSEITDDNYDEEEADKPIYSLALDTIETIDNSTESTHGFHQILEIYQSILTEDPPEEQVSTLIENLRNGPDSWQAKYAVIASLSALMNPFADLDIQFLLSTFNLIIPYLDQQFHPLIHIAIYQYIKNSCDRVDAKGIAEIIDKTIQSAFEEESDIARQKAFKTIACYFKNQVLNHYHGFVYNAFYQPYFAQFIEELQREPPEINKYIVQCVGYMAKQVKEQYKYDFEETTQIFSDLLEQTEDFSFSIKIISSFTVSISYLYRVFNFKNNPAFCQICFFFLQNALQLYGSDNIDEEEAEELTIAIAVNLEIVGIEAIPLFDEFLPNVFDIAMRQIEIERSQALEGIFGLTSIYTQIPSPDEGVKCFASRNDITEVKQALLILKSIIYIMPDNTQYIEQVTSIANYWISYNYFIEDLVTYSFDILEALSDNDRQNLNYIDFLLQCFAGVMGKYGSIKYLTDLYILVNRIIERAQKENWQNQELFENILSNIPDFIEYLVQLKLNYSDNMHSYNSYNFRDKKLHFITNLMDTVNDLIDKFFKFSVELTYQYLSDLIPKVFELMKNYELVTFAVGFIYNVYLYTNPDLQQICEFIQFLLGTITNLTHDHRKLDTTEHLFLVLGNTLLNFDLGEFPQFVDGLVYFFYNYINKISENEEEDKKDDDIDQEEHYNDSITDSANVAFSKLLIKNLKYTSDTDNSILIWYDCKPLWDETQDSQYYYQFLMDLIEQKLLEKLDISWEDDFLPKILKDVNPDIYGEDNLRRLAICLNNILSTPDGKQLINEAIEKMISSYTSGNDDDDDAQSAEEFSTFLKNNLYTILNYDPRIRKKRPN